MHAAVELPERRGAQAPSVARLLSRDELEVPYRLASETKTAPTLSVLSYNVLAQGNMRDEQYPCVSAPLGCAPPRGLCPGWNG